MKEKKKPGTGWGEAIRILSRGVRMVHGLERRLIPVAVTASVFKALYPFVNIYMTALILNELYAGKRIPVLAVYAVVTVGLNWILQLGDNGLSVFRNYLILSMDHKQNQMMSEKIMTMEYSYAESARTHEEKQEIENRCMMMGRNLWGVTVKVENFVNSIVKIAVSAGLVFPLFITGERSGLEGFERLIGSPWFAVGLAVCVFASVIYSMYISVKQNEKELALSMDGTLSKKSRRYNFFNNYLENYKTGKDVRLYNEKGLILDEIKKTTDGIQDMMTTFFGTRGKYGAIQAAVSVTVTGLVYLFVGLKALAGYLLVGNIVQYTGSITQFIDGISLFMTELADVRMMAEDFRLFYQFMEKPDMENKGTLTVDEGSREHELEFVHVSFTYPDSETEVLKDLNLKIHAGTKMAVVGMNGSGKTTMIKLLCRLYNPTKGKILLDGKDIREYDLSSYQRLLGVVFQDFKLFSMPLAENIAAGKEYDEKRVEESLKQAGLWERVTEMKDGIRTPLYKDCYEDGVEISGGEAQKAAIARALYRNAGFVILDEPTAALDPISEYEIYNRFDEMIEGRTAIYISHRLSSCRFCQDIVVFDKGRLVQRGSHEELIKDKNGKYTELWNAQAQYYDDTVKKALKLEDGLCQA